MLLPGKHDVTMVRGVSWDLRVQWLVSGDEPVDLTGWSGALRIKRRPQDATSVLECTTANGRLELDDEGYVVARLSKTLVDTLPLGSMSYELELFSTNESVQLLSGAVKVTP